MLLDPDEKLVTLSVASRMVTLVPQTLVLDLRNAICENGASLLLFNRSSRDVWFEVRDVHADTATEGKTTDAQALAPGQTALLEVTVSVAAALEDWLASVGEETLEVMRGKLYLWSRDPWPDLWASPEAVREFSIDLQLPCATPTEHKLRFVFETSVVV
jgi:hypothetical protein